MKNNIPTVLLPGLLCSPDLFANQLSTLWRYGSVTIADTARDDNLVDMATRVLKDAPEKFALIGLSMGGYLAFEIMRQAPNRVLKLALLDTSARADNGSQVKTRKKMVQLAKDNTLNDVLELAFKYSVDASHRQNQAIRETVIKMGLAVGIDGFIRQQDAIMGRQDSRPDLSRIHCQTMVLVGEGDEITPLECAQEIVDNIPNAQLVTIPNCGHLSTLEQPEAVNTALKAWLNEGE